MPKRLYGSRTRWELSSVKRRKGVVSTWKLEEAPVFEFLETKLSRKPLGSRATYKKDKQDGKYTEYVYEKTPRGYLLVERKNYDAQGTPTRSTPVPDFRVGRPIRKGKTRDTRKKYEYEK